MAQNLSSHAATLRNSRITRWIVAVALVTASLIVTTAGVARATSSAPIVSGAIWRDTNGNPIVAHAGTMIAVGGIYYWVGVSKNDDGTFRAITCYSSSDLTTWTRQTDLLTPQPSGDLTSTSTPTKPNILYNASTNTYVMWMALGTTRINGYAARATFQTSAQHPTLCSAPFNYVGKIQPNGQPSADLTLYQDSSGTAYIVHVQGGAGTGVAWTEWVQPLTSDYMNVTGTAVQIYPGQTREAPSVVKYDGTYYIFTSGTSGWSPNQAEYITASSMSGPWSSPQPIGNSVRYYSQSDFVVPVTGAQGTTYLTMADRWNGQNGGVTWNLDASTYVWLPLEFSGATPVLNWYGNWTIDPANGTWTTLQTPGSLDYFRDFENQDLTGLTTNGGPWSVYTESGNPDEHWLEKASSTGTNNTTTCTTCIPTSYAYVQAAVDLTGDGSASVIGRATDANHYYQFSVVNDGTSQKWRLDKYDTGTITPLATGPTTVTFNTWYTLRLKMNGNDLVGSISSDGGASFTTVVSATDPSSPYTSGYIGVKGFQSVSYFDNLSMVNLS